MKLLATRYHFAKTFTMSRLSVIYNGPLRYTWHPDGARWVPNDDPDQIYPFAYWLEDRDRWLDKEMPLAQLQQLKIKKETAIPAGLGYIIGTRNSPAHGERALTILDVPAFKFIDIHSGNTPVHTEGCPLPGLVPLLDQGKILESSKAVKWLKQVVYDCQDRGETVSLDIVRDGELYHD